MSFVGTRPKRPNEGANGPDPKRLRITDAIASLPSDQVAGFVKYLTSLSIVVREREKGACHLETIPGAQELLINSIVYTIGEFWQTCVELSRIRIDVAAHEVLYDLVQEDLSPIVRLEALKSVDNLQRSRLPTQQTGPTSQAHLLMAGITGGGGGAGGEEGGGGPDGSSVVRSGRGRGIPKRRGRKPMNEIINQDPAAAGASLELTPQAIAPSGLGGSVEASRGFPKASALFDETQERGIEDSNAVAEHARELSLVQRKQAELSREVTLEDIECAMQLAAGEDDQYVVKMPVRLRKQFRLLSSFFYEPFLEKVLACKSVAQTKPPINVHPLPTQQQQQVHPQQQQQVHPQQQQQLHPQQQQVPPQQQPAPNPQMMMFRR